MMQPLSKIEGLVIPGESLVRIHLGKVKELKSDVHGRWKQPQMQLLKKN